MTAHRDSNLRPNVRKFRGYQLNYRGDRCCKAKFRLKKKGAKGAEKYYNSLEYECLRFKQGGEFQTFKLGAGKKVSSKVEGNILNNLRSSGWRPRITWN